MGLKLNYRHLYYFWVVAKEGGMARAAERLDMAVQTISAQVRELERSLGVTLLKPAGRGVVLTDAGHIAMLQAEEIFQLGERLGHTVRDAVTPISVRLSVGVADSVPNLVVWRLMQPAMQGPNLRLLFHVDEFDDLLADLALHRLDIVLADRAAPPSPNLRLYSHPLAASPISWWAPPSWIEQARQDFPTSLSMVPVLLPTTHSALRTRLDQWFERHAIRPKVAGEFEDSAMLKSFGARGMGVFPAPDLVQDELSTSHGVQRLGNCEGVEEHYFAIATEKKVTHPLVERLLPRGPRSH
jgi:LysR family transcriptional regulator, transcriptional activator of nhaA